MLFAQALAGVGSMKVHVHGWPRTEGRRFTNEIAIMIGQVSCPI